MFAFTLIATQSSCFKSFLAAKAAGSKLGRPRTGGAIGAGEEKMANIYRWVPEGGVGGAHGTTVVPDSGPTPVQLITIQ